MERNLSRRAWLASGLTTVGAGVTAGALSAADGDKAAKSKDALRDPLTLESLGTMLSALGLKATKTESRYDFSFTARHGEEWNLSMSVVLSTDEKSVWIMAWLDELPKSSADVPRTALLRLLADNDKIGHGMFFAYVQSNRRFVLQRVLRNDNITSKSFHADLLELGATVVNTYPHWTVTNWKQLGTSSSASAKDTGDDDKSTSGESRPSAPPSSKSTSREASSGSSKKKS
jgi:hypothetical protein